MTAQISPDSRREIYGETRPAVEKVVVHFRLPSGRRGRRAAEIIRVDDREALRAARIREPFGYFLAFVPAKARRVFATALDADGNALARLRYDAVVNSLDPHAFIARGG